MIMYIGGACQGKTALACREQGLSRQDFLDGETCLPSDLPGAKALRHFHVFLKRLMEQEPDPEKAAECIYRAAPGLLIVTDEIGYGIVPVDKEERAWREYTGRVCTCLAAKSRRVVRVMYGIGQVLK